MTILKCFDLFGIVSSKKSKEKKKRIQNAESIAIKLKVEQRTLMNRTNGINYNKRKKKCLNKAIPRPTPTPCSQFFFFAFAFITLYANEHELYKLI